MENAIDRKELLSFIERVKPIVSKKVNVPYEDWIFFDGNYVYAFNGLFFFLQPFDAPKEMALPVVPVKAMLSRLHEDTVSILIGIDSVTIECQGNQADFNYPFKSISDYMQSFYVETAPIENYTSLPSYFRDAIDFCSKSTFPMNIEYSNIYVQDNMAMSSDGYKIATRFVDCPDASFSLGIEKVLGSVGEPDLILIKDSTVSFRIGDSVLSMVRNIGNVSAVSRYIPNTSTATESFRIENPSEWKQALLASKAFDIEFKKKDVTVHVSIEDGEAVISTEGVKSKYTHKLKGVYSSSNLAFRIHPDHLISLVEMEGEVRFGTNDFLVCESESENECLYLWVEV